MWLRPHALRRGNGYLKRSTLLPISPLLSTPPPPLAACWGDANNASPGITTPRSSPFTSTTSPQKKLTQFPPRPRPPPEEEITEAYLKGSGPGGQKINKTNSAVQLKHIPTGIVVKCQDTRSRSQNRKLAREHLAEKIDDLLNGDNSRSAIVARMKARKKASAAKKSRRKHNGPDDEGEEEEAQDNDFEEDGIEEHDEHPQQVVKTGKTVKIQEVRQR
ncbi:hypothetical protein VMCG_10512 [Cytospora schulzeri]|uniref:Prokaryotic-type class I peptide chain release factors domain-containing protein n=1 Tax=Cytospora schulzeri TaxID=448051 RepID=A0A423V9C0_9PEZI|nr:hypothetical protein VMCG_10512 [Valsa malicola]